MNNSQKQLLIFDLNRELKFIDDIIYNILNISSPTDNLLDLLIRTAHNISFWEQAIYAKIGYPKTKKLDPNNPIEVRLIKLKYRTQAIHAKLQKINTSLYNSITPNEPNDLHIMSYSHCI